MYRAHLIDRWDDATGSNLYEHRGGVNDLRLASATFAATRVPLSLAAAGRSSLLTDPRTPRRNGRGSADMSARPHLLSTATASATTTTTTTKNCDTARFVVTPIAFV
jgi:hypothetical protein